MRIEDVVAIAKEADKAIMEVYRDDDSWNVVYKDNDMGPVTEADTRANKIIQNGLQKLDPSIPILGEEEDVIPPYETRQHWKEYWCVDPLDGTKEFIASKK